MTSTNTYITTIPYFYIIQHKTSKKMYAGSKWAVGCHPDEFMQPNGYQTSSNAIKTIIEQEGLDSFVILRIDINLDNLSAYEYESLFLQTLNCARSDEWYNGHNNSGMAFGLPEFYKKSKQTVQEKYGYDFITQVSEIKEQQKQTRYEKHGGNFWGDESLKKQKQTVQERYGVDNVSQSLIIQEKKKQTTQKRYGVEYSTQILEAIAKGRQTKLTKHNGKFRSDDSLEKTKQTVQEKYGYEYISQVPELKKKQKQTNIEKTGYEYSGQVPEYKEKARQTRYEKNGGKYVSDEEIERRKHTHLKRIGYDNPSKRPFLSIVETKRTYPKCIISRDFKEFKQYY